MKIKVDRIYKGESYTIGKMYLNGEYFCDTLEDAIRPVKIPNETAIPAGTYKVILSYSNRFKRILPEILNVPHFLGIRIHRGNTEQDSAGCIILGENKIKGKVINSTPYETKLVKLLENQKNITITII